MNSNTHLAQLEKAARQLEAVLNFNTAHTGTLSKACAIFGIDLMIELL